MYFIRDCQDFSIVIVVTWHLYSFCDMWGFLSSVGEIKGLLDPVDVA
jgi:hypothetical protein